jgi:hypothetical protein
VVVGRRRGAAGRREHHYVATLGARGALVDGVRQREPIAHLDQHDLPEHEPIAHELLRHGVAQLDGSPQLEPVTDPRAARRRDVDDELAALGRQHTPLHDPSCGRRLLRFRGRGARSPERPARGEPQRQRAAPPCPTSLVHDELLFAMVGPAPA